MKSISPAWAVSRIALIVAVLLASTTSNAAEEPWKFGAEVYLWGANIDIESSTGSDSEIRFTDIVSDLEFAGMVRLATQRGKWRIGADLIYLDIDDDIEATIGPGIELNDLALEAWVVTPMVGYQLLKSERATLHALVGARYLWIEVSEKFDFGPPLPDDTIKASESDGSWDGSLACAASGSSPRSGTAPISSTREPAIRISPGRASPRSTTDSIALMLRSATAISTGRTLKTTRSVI
jgi:hypothetical protein